MRATIFRYNKSAASMLFVRFPRTTGGETTLQNNTNRTTMNEFRIIAARWANYVNFKTSIEIRDELSFESPKNGVREPARRRKVVEVERAMSEFFERRTQDIPLFVLSNFHCWPWRLGWEQYRRQEQWSNLAGRHFRHTIAANYKVTKLLHSSEF